MVLTLTIYTTGWYVKQMETNKNNAFFEALKAGLEDILAHKQGKLMLKSETIEIPAMRPSANSHASSVHAKKKAKTK